MPFDDAPALGATARLGGRAVSDAVQPGADAITWPNRRRLAHQDEKRRLKRVFGVVRIGEDTATNAKNHRAVTADEGRERGLFVLRQKAVEQLAVAQRRGLA